MPTNDQAIADNAGDFDPWIELFNAGTNAIDLSEYRLGNSAALHNLWSFPTGLVIEAQARLLLWADAETHETDPANHHTDFRLHSVSGTVVLVREFLGRHIVLDALTYDHVPVNRSYGSVPEGSPYERHILYSPTPGSTNRLDAPLLNVFINEWMADNQSRVLDPTDNRFDDWFEIYNASAETALLGGYTLTDDPLRPDQFVIPGGTAISPRGFLLVWADGDTDDNVPGDPLHVNFSLSRDGESIGLYAPDGTKIDSVSFASQLPNLSEGRWPDGASGIQALAPATPAASNRLFVITELSDLAPDQLGFEFMSISGQVYRVEGNSNLFDDTWQILDVITADTEAMSFVDPAFSTNAIRYYRVTEP